MPKSIFKLFFIVSIFLFFLCLISCKKSVEPLNKNRQYSANIMYIKDDNLPSFEAKDFIEIFNNRMPFLTYQILGYKIKYNLAYGNNLNGFYRENRNIIKNASIFENKKINPFLRLTLLLFIQTLHQVFVQVFHLGQKVKNQTVLDCVYLFLFLC